MERYVARRRYRPPAAPPARPSTYTTDQW